MLFPFQIVQRVRRRKHVWFGTYCIIHLWTYTRRTIDFKSLRINEKGWQGTINMQRFLYFNYIFSRVEDDRFALEFRGRARRVGDAQEGQMKEKKGRRKRECKRKLRKSRRTRLRLKIPQKSQVSKRRKNTAATLLGQPGNRLIGSSVLKRGESISVVSRMTSYKFSECNFVRASLFVSVQKNMFHICAFAETNRSLRYCAP